jgi:hypothetical protein
MTDLLQAQTYALIADLGKLATDLPVDGSVVFLGRQVVDHSLSWSDEKAARLGRVVDALCTPLLQAGRSLDTLVLEYENGALMIVTRDALRLAVVMREMVERPDDLIADARRILDTHGESIFRERGIQRPLQVQPRAMVPQPSAAITVAATTTVNKLIVPATNTPAAKAAAIQAKPEPVPSPDVPAAVAMELAAARLAMVMGRKAATDLVAREAAKAGLERDSMLDATTGREFIARIFSHVPHKAKRESLTFECQSLFLESLK